MGISPRFGRARFSTWYLAGNNDISPSPDGREPKSFRGDIRCVAMSLAAETRRTDRTPENRPVATPAAVLARPRTIAKRVINAFPSVLALV